MSFVDCVMCGTFTHTLHFFQFQYAFNNTIYKRVWAVDLDVLN